MKLPQAQLLKVTHTAEMYALLLISFFFFFFWVVGDGGINPSSEEMSVLGEESRASTKDPGPKRCRFEVSVFFSFFC